MSEWERIKAAFHAASALKGDDRRRVLDALCGNDAQMRSEVESLLRMPETPPVLTGHGARAAVAIAAGSPGTGTEDTVDHGPESASIGTGFTDIMNSSPLSEGPGSRIGPYKLLQLIGEGGFGSVFLAEQQEPVQRKVALKIIKLGMDTRQVVARFEQERQALAVMDHPNIAKVIGGGATSAGRPYFVMELVRGEPITRYCDQQKLTIQQRLELFVQVCNALQHAHQKGVIHRDIKPSNVLVSTTDGRPFAKVIDFGIAKATGGRMTEKTFFTEHRQLIGTPEYMSPEQADGLLDIDTRTDVYSLGVLLYELLTGRTPFDGKTLRSAAFGELQRIIREVEPPNPSTRLSQSADLLAGIAAQRNVPPGRLGPLIRGELDWIVMKAMEKDRARRYGAPSELAGDLQRHLAGEPVVAAPPSRTYRALKFLRRHRAAATTGSVLALAVVLGLVGTGVGLVKARRSEQQALQANELLRAEKAVSARTADKLGALHGFFIDKLLGANDPEIALGQNLRVRQVLDNAAAQADQAENPEVRADLHHEIGLAYLALELWAKAREQFEAALRIREASPSTTKTELAETLIGFGRAQCQLESPDRGEGALRKARALRAEAFGDDSDQAAEADLLLSQSLERLGRSPEASALSQAALDALARRNPPGRESVAFARVIVERATSTSAPAGDFDQAARALRRAVGIFRRESNAASHLAWALGNLSNAASNLGLHEEAESSGAESLAINRKLFPEGGAQVANSLAALALARMRAGGFEDAESLARESLDMYAKDFGPEHEFVASTRKILGAVLASQQRWPEAAEQYRAAVDVLARKFPGDDVRTANGKSQLGGCLAMMDSDRFPEAESLLLDAYAVLERLRAGAPARRVTAARLADLYAVWEKPEKAAVWSAAVDKLDKELLRRE